MDYIMLGQRIRHYRQKLHMTQEGLAEKAEVSASFLGHIERGTRVASLETVMKLCIALNITPNELLGDELDILRSDLPERIVVDPKAIMREMSMMLVKFAKQQ